MPRSGQPKRVTAATRPVLALLLLGQWLLLLAFASSEKLHHSICDRAKQPTHDCAFAAVAKSQLLSLGETVQAPLPRPVTIASLIQRHLILHSSEDFRLAPNRGPPVDILPT